MIKGQTNSGSFKKGRISETKGRKAYQFICLNCGKRIDTSDKRRKYCSHQCHLKHNWKTGKRKKEHIRKLGINSKGRIAKPNSGSFTRERILGKKNYNWKGGIVSVNHKIRTSNEWKEWRTKVFTRDNFTCQDCGLQGVELHPHHINPISIYPELAFDINNGKTLCIDCHIHSKKYHKKVNMGGK